MNERMLPFLAIILSLVAILAAVVVQPDTEIKSGSIDSEKIGNSAVTSSKLADNTVTTEDIADGTITDNDINTTGISRIKDSSIGTNHLTQTVLDLLYLNVSFIGNNSITSEKIKDYNIKNVDIANNTISSEKILDNTITEDDIGSDAVGIDELQEDSVDEDNIQDDSINSDHIQDGAVDTDDIAENAVTEFWQKNTSLGVGLDSTMEQDEFVNLTYATLNITTGNNPLLILFSGVFSASVAEEAVQIMLHIDGDPVIPTTRKGTSVSGDSTFTLAFNYITELESGDHTIQVKWRVAPSGIAPTANAYNRILDIIEMKK
jgi:hypothetical protein